MAATATGDALFLGVVLGLAAVDVVVGAAAVLAGLGVLGRWGSSSLAALAGGQAVLGPAGWTGSVAAIVSSWGGALALLLVAPPRLIPVIAFGVTAAELVAGPALGAGNTAAGLALRVAASAAAVAGAWTCTRYVPRRLARPVGVAVAAAAMVLGFLV